MFWELLSPLQVLKVGVSDMRFDPLALREKLQVLSSLLIVGHCTRGGVYGEIVSQPLLSSLMWVFFFFSFA